MFDVHVDGQRCVVGADSEGYIPLTFTRGQTVDIVQSFPR